MFDKFCRKIDYLRISVTDRCDMRCVYCMPEQGVPQKGHGAILSYEQIESFVQVAADMGITKVRLTGGEPLVRRKIVHLVELLSRINGIQDLSITTNGSRLRELGQALKSAGLHRLNISLDTLDPQRFTAVTRGGDLGRVLQGIDVAIEAGFSPIKINMVIFADTTEEEVSKMQIFCNQRRLQLQKIMQFSLYDRKDLSTRLQVERPPTCSECNKLRLTADGHLKPCLFSEDEIEVDFNRIEDSIYRAVMAKPENGSSCKNRSMRQIGG